MKAKTKLKGKGKFTMPTVRVPIGVHRAVKKEAIRQGRSLNNHIVQLMVRSLTAPTKRRTRQLQAAE